MDTAEKASRLIAEVGSPALRVVMDPANYFHLEMLPRMEAVLRDVFRHVGGHIALAHAKDVVPPPPGGEECLRPAAGTGVLDYSVYLSLLRDHGYAGGLILHSLTEAQLPASLGFLRRGIEG